MTFHIARLFACAALLSLALSACAARESYDLNTYVTQTAKDRAEATQALINAAPQLKGSFTSAPDPRPPLESTIDRGRFAADMAWAITGVTGSHVTRIILVDAASANGNSGGSLDGSLNPGCDRCRIGTSYVASLANHHAATVMNALGAGGWSKLQYRVRATIADKGEPGIQETVFYYLAYAMALPYHENRSVAFDMIIRYLPYAVPLGEKAGEPGAWYVKVRR